jgi:cytochrome P450
MNPEVFP